MIKIKQIVFADILQNLQFLLHIFCFFSYSLCKIQINYTLL
jgi:hypothetical protein